MPVAQYFKSAGRIICLILALLFTCLRSYAQPAPPAAGQDPLMQLMLAQPRIDVDSPVVPVAWFDPPAVKPGEQATYRVMLNALETAVTWPEKIPVPKGLAARLSAHGQILSMAGPLLVPRTTFNYRVHPSETGQFTIPEFTVTVNGKSIAVPAAHLDVNASLSPGISPAQQLLLDIPTNALFVGQAIRARVVLPGGPGGAVQSIGQVQLNGQGFIVDLSSAHIRIEALPFGTGGRAVNSFVYELMLTPLASGSFSVSAQAYSVGNRVVGGVIVPGPAGGALPQYTLVDSEPAVLTVRPLPRASELPGFTGAVGLYSVDPPDLSTNIFAVGDPVKLKIKVRGEGNLARLVPPPPPHLKEWQIFSQPPENTPSPILQAQGFISLEYILIPLSEKIHNTPVIPFCSFNPDRGVYEDLSIPSIPVTVLPGTVTAADLQTIERAQNIGEKSEPEPTLSGLAVTSGLTGSITPMQLRGWFPLLHLVPGGALLGLWLWDRRRRFLELNPGLVLRRRALRSLRRQRRALERAAHARDTAGFATVAVNAMQVAVAPYFPAEPRALVGADVLSVLPDDQRSGQAGETVRRLFSSADGARFAAARHTPREVLELHSQIEGVLDHLEARLCS